MDKPKKEPLDILNSIFKQAIDEHATDIHWEPSLEGDENFIIVRFRTDGILRDVARIDRYQVNLESLINAIKIMGKMDPTKKRREQDGKIAYKFDQAEFDLRISSMPTIIGEKVVMRIIDKRRFCVRLEDLGMSQIILKSYKNIINKAAGFIIVTGPTGSGKTTTLYATLQEISSRKQNICTIEDPVECRFSGINQIPVEHEFGMTFVSGLRAIMRQDPDIIAVGEIRDVETARVAFQAALAGSLVFSTLHAKDAVNTVVRLLNTGIEPYFIATALTGVISQRLVRLVCKICKGQGCPQCNNSGFKRRIGVFELMKVTDKIRNLVLKDAPADMLKQAALEEGMISFQNSAELLISKGFTTLEEVRRVLAFEE